MKRSLKISPKAGHLCENLVGNTTKVKTSAKGTLDSERFMLELSETIAKVIEEQHISVRELAKRAYHNL